MRTPVFSRPFSFPSPAPFLPHPSVSRFHFSSRYLLSSPSHPSADLSLSSPISSLRPGPFLTPSGPCSDNLSHELPVCFLRFPTPSSVGRPSLTANVCLEGREGCGPQSLDSRNETSAALWATGEGGAAPQWPREAPWLGHPGGLYICGPVWSLNLLQCLLVPDLFGLFPGLLLPSFGCPDPLAVTLDAPVSGDGWGPGGAILSVGQGGRSGQAGAGSPAGAQASPHMPLPVARQFQAPRSLLRCAKDCRCASLPPVLPKRWTRTARGFFWQGVGRGFPERPRRSHRVSGVSKSSPG